MPSPREWRCGLDVLLLISIALTLAAAFAPDFGRAPAPARWLSSSDIVIMQRGTTGRDAAFATAATPSGGAVVVGETSGAWASHSSAGDKDLFVMQVSSSGVVEWTRQRGTSGTDGARGVAVDNDGGIFVAGYTTGALDGQTHAGNEDYFVSHFSSAGDWRWTRQRGTFGSDQVNAVVVDGSGGIFVAGFTGSALDGQTWSGGGDLFVAKFDQDGDLQWTRQRGTANDEDALAIAADVAGNVVVAGTTTGALDGQDQIGGQDFFLLKFNAVGDWQWTRQRGTTRSMDFANGVAVDSTGDIFVTGQVTGVLDGQVNPKGIMFSGGLFLSKFSSAGEWQWTRVRGTPAIFSKGVVVDQFDDVLVAGFAKYGDLDDQGSAGSGDALLMKYSGTGEWIWTQQFGTSGNDVLVGLADAGSGKIWAAGNTAAAFEGETSAGGEDVFLMTYLQPSPQPTQSPSPAPTPTPTRSPTPLPTTPVPTFAPTSAPTLEPTLSPTARPTRAPTPGPTSAPTRAPTPSPTIEPTPHPTPPPRPASSGDENFLRQRGTPQKDVALAIATDNSKGTAFNGGTFVAGYTSGAFDDQASAGGEDYFLMKFDHKGNWQTLQQRGTQFSDRAVAMTVDGAGGVFVAGYTGGSLDGQNSAGDDDLFFARFDHRGIWQWTRQRGGSAVDRASAIACDGHGSVFVAGYTGGTFDGQTSSGGLDLFVVKFTADGEWQWTRQRGTVEPDEARAIAVDASGNVFVAGTTGGALDGQTSMGSRDFFLMKFSGTGSWQWTRQRGTTASLDFANGVAVDSYGAVYVAGHVTGILDGQTNPVNLMFSGGLFLSKFDGDGTWQWTRTRGNPSVKGAAVVIDPQGDPIVVGNILYDAGVDGWRSAGGTDVVLVKYSSTGEWNWTRQRGTVGDDIATALVGDRHGAISVVGTTDGSFETNSSVGGDDVFLINFQDYTYASSRTYVPTPTPTPAPTIVPTEPPTVHPTHLPTSTPTWSPTSAPSQSPTPAPTPSPTLVPTSAPTVSPTALPTFVPTPRPTTAPTSQPTRLPTAVPTQAPTPSPTPTPTSAPSPSPTVVPTMFPPTPAPTHDPTAQPTSVACVMTALSVTGGWVTAPAMQPGASRTVDCPPGYSGQVVAECRDGVVSVVAESCAETAAPILTPTLMPTRHPTGQPTPYPTSAPTPKPTPAPASCSTTALEMAAGWITVPQTSHGSTQALSCASGHVGDVVVACNDGNFSIVYDSCTKITANPTLVPTAAPTRKPTRAAVENQEPSLAPTPVPTHAPTLPPTYKPCAATSVQVTGGNTTVGSMIHGTSVVVGCPPHFVGDVVVSCVNGVVHVLFVQCSRAPTPTPTSAPTPLPSTGPTLMPSATPTASPTLLQCVGSVQSTGGTVDAVALNHGESRVMDCNSGYSGTLVVFCDNGVFSLVMENCSTSFPSSSPTFTPTYPGTPMVAAPTSEPTSTVTGSDCPASRVQISVGWITSPFLVDTASIVIGCKNGYAGQVVLICNQSTVSVLADTCWSDTQAPTQSPSVAPSTPAPFTHSPSNAPTQSPTLVPTSTPHATVTPTQLPPQTPAPSLSPTQGRSPTASPTLDPTSSPPTGRPSLTPTQAPTLDPTVGPTVLPTPQPTASPTPAPPIQCPDANLLAPTSDCLLVMQSGQRCYAACSGRTIPVGFIRCIRLLHAEMDRGHAAGTSACVEMTNGSRVETFQKLYAAMRIEYTTSGNLLNVLVFQNALVSAFNISSDVVHNVTIVRDWQGSPPSRRLGWYGSRELADNSHDAADQVMLEVDVTDDEAPVLKQKLEALFVSGSTESQAFQRAVWKETSIDIVVISPLSELLVIDDERQVLTSTSSTSSASSAASTTMTSTTTSVTATATPMVRAQAAEMVSGASISVIAAASLVIVIICCAFASVPLFCRCCRRRAKVEHHPNFDSLRRAPDKRTEQDSAAKASGVVKGHADESDVLESANMATSRSPAPFAQNELAELAAWGYVLPRAPVLPLTQNIEKLRKDKESMAVAAKHVFLTISDGEDDESTRDGDGDTIGGGETLPRISCTGCRNPSISELIEGTYLASGTSHGRAIYKKLAGGATGVSIYYDDKDSIIGWWIGSDVDSNRTWAYNAAKSSAPPGMGWRVPVDGAMDMSLQLVVEGATPLSEGGSARPAVFCGGCKDAAVAQSINGRYIAKGTHCGKPAYQRQGSAGSSTIYYDDRPLGMVSRGWWIAPDTRGSQPWAFNGAMDAASPPASGWRVPWDGDVDDGLQVLPDTASDRSSNSSRSSAGRRRSSASVLRHYAKLREQADLQAVARQMWPSLADASDEMLDHVQVDRCVCGNVYMMDSIFCPNCGLKRADHKEANKAAADKLAAVLAEVVQDDALPPRDNLLTNAWLAIDQLKIDIPDSKDALCAADPATTRCGRSQAFGPAVDVSARGSLDAG